VTIKKEVERNDEYSIFKLRVRPTYDFQQELLWNREELEFLNLFGFARRLQEL
jgi:hypothetical protein